MHTPALAHTFTSTHSCAHIPLHNLTITLSPPTHPHPCTSHTLHFSHPALLTHTSQPLHYAASRGNKRLIQILLGSNANVTIMCNLGETAASIAYAHDHTAVADMLENAVSSRGTLPSSSTSLPPHPLLDNTASGGATSETKAR